MGLGLSSSWMGWLSSVSWPVGPLLSLHCKVQTNLGSPAHEDMLVISE